MESSSPIDLLRKEEKVFQAFSKLRAVPLRNRKTDIVINIFIIISICIFLSLLFYFTGVFNSAITSIIIYSSIALLFVGIKVYDKFEIESIKKKFEEESSFKLKRGFLVTDKRPFYLPYIAMRLNDEVDFKLLPDLDYFIESFSKRANKRNNNWAFITIASVFLLTLWSETIGAILGKQNNVVEIIFVAVITLGISIIAAVIAYFYRKVFEKVILKEYDDYDLLVDVLGVIKKTLKED
ncbi:hypothetical protein ACE6ED_22370 [Paenibacillus sp. CN-4]|uniref:hypothetical protein n=1 Tax=Paenibacillus nanchangensis TaxID=3348343 RepID=UPI00397CADCF